MRLDVIIPTYNRAHLLGGTLRSLVRASMPETLDTRVIVVDNNSSDETRAVVARLQGEHPALGLRYVFESRQGRSSALNAGIAVSDAELLGLIDDDEEVDAQWFQAIASAFTDDGLDFIGGPCKPLWVEPAPPWLPPDYPGVIGMVSAGDEPRPYGPDYPGTLMGGNTVIRREVLTKVGGYAPWLGRRGTRLLAGEDEHLYQRLLAARARGMYLPELVIYHWIPPERLTRSYHRRWCFWRAVSWAGVNKQHPQKVRYLLGIPRYLYGNAARGLLRAARGLLRHGRYDAASFSGELALWDLAGFFVGTHFTHRGRRATGPSGPAA